MGFYREHVLPRFVDRACAVGELRQWREDVTAGLTGRVIEVGFGSGLNLDHYPVEVEVVLAVEPAATAKRLAARRIARSRTPVEDIGVDGRSIPLEDRSCDSGLSTFTLCTIPDPETALEELYRVLRPGARFHFLEHGLSSDPSVAAWQRRLDPLQSRLFGGCHLTRDAADLVARAGFRLESVRRGYAKGPKPWSWFTVGVATKPHES